MPFANASSTMALTGAARSAPTVTRAADEMKTIGRVALARPAVLHSLTFSIHLPCTLEPEKRELQARDLDHQRQYRLSQPPIGHRSLERAPQCIWRWRARAITVCPYCGT